MGLFDRLGLSKQRFEDLGSPTALASPWGDGADEASILPRDIYGEDFDLAFDTPLTRQEAMLIPGVSKAVHLLSVTIAQLPLAADNGTGPENTAQPNFLTRTDLVQAPQDRLWCTVDDLFFFGRSLWITERGAFNQILKATWVRYETWEIEKDTVLYQGSPLNPGEFLLFNVPMWAGIIAEGRRTLRGATDMERAWTSRMQSPTALTELHVTDDSQLEQHDVDEYVQAWTRKHRAGKPAVGMTPPGIQLITHENSIGSADLFLQARDAIRSDIGAFSSIDGGMLDASGGSDSLTYETQTSIRAWFYEFDLPFWLVPIASRLSQDDVTPRGTVVKFLMPEVEARANPQETQKRETITEAVTPGSDPTNPPNTVVPQSTDNTKGVADG